LFTHLFYTNTAQYQGSQAALRLFLKSEEVTLCEGERERVIM